MCLSRWSDWCTIQVICIHAPDSFLQVTNAFLHRGAVQSLSDCPHTQRANREFDRDSVEKKLASLCLFFHCTVTTCATSSAHRYTASFFFSILRAAMCDKMKNSWFLTIRRPNAPRERKQRLMGASTAKTGQTLFQSGFHGLRGAGPVLFHQEGLCSLTQHKTTINGWHWWKVITIPSHSSAIAELQLSAFDLSLVKANLHSEWAGAGILVTIFMTTKGAWSWFGSTDACGQWLVDPPQCSVSCVTLLTLRVQTSYHVFTVECFCNK